MKKSSSTIKNKERAKSFSFFTRITTLLIIAAAIVVSAIFSVFYLDQNSNLSIEFAGGYQTQVQYEGVYEENSQTQQVINLLENRVDPLGTSNIIVEKSTSTGNYYNLSISKSAGIDLPIFINNVSRRGYVYLLDSQGHDLLANKFDKDNNKWSAREERLTTSEAFSSIASKTNPNSGQPEVVFTIKSKDLLETIQAVIESSNEVYFYSDIGQLLNYVRNILPGLQELVRFIDEQDSEQQPALKALLANNVTGLADSTGQKMYDAIKRPNTAEGKLLINLLNQSKNGVYTIDWLYSDTSSNTPLSVDTNNKENVFDPDDPFNPDNTNNKGTISPVNAWLAHIKDLIILPEVSAALNTAIINYKYAPYYIGSIGVTNVNPTNSTATINDDTFNKEKVQQIENILNAGKNKNNFTVLSVLMVEPTLGAQALKVAVIGMLVALFLLSVAIIFNYRLLGLSAVLIIILFLVATLVAFTFLNNVVAPETGIALIIGFALLLDTIVGLFNRIQKEYQSGKSVFDSFKTANKKSLVSAVDCSIIVLIVSLTIFWFGARSIRGFAIMTSISSFGVILIGVFLLRFLLYFLLKNNTFEKRPDLLALKHKDILASSEPLSDAALVAPNKKDSKKVKKVSKTKKTINKTKIKLAMMKQSFVKTMKLDQKSNIFHISQWNFWHKTTKWIMVAASVILVLSGIVYLAAGSNFGPGFDSRIDFTGEASASSADLSELDLWKEAEEHKAIVVAELDANQKSYQKVYAALNLNSIGQTQNALKVIIQTNISEDDALAFYQFLNDNIRSMSWNYTENNALSGNQLFKEMLIVIAISLIMIFIYVIVRFQLTFAIPLIAALVFTVFTALALISLLQITISTMTIGVILALVVLVLINSVVIFDNIKEIKLNNNEKRNSFDKNEIIAISNEGIKKSLSRTLALNGIIILTALIVLCFLPSFWAVSLAIIFGTIVAFIGTHFVGPWLWTFFERWRIKRYKKRAEKIKKHFVGPDEYIIEGIND